MNNFTQYIPDIDDCFEDDYEPTAFEFETIHDFLNHEYVRCTINREDFYKFSIYMHKESNSYTIIVIYKKEDKHNWDFYGFIKNDIPELDRWTWKN